MERLIKKILIKFFNYTEEPYIDYQKRIAEDYERRLAEGLNKELNMFGNTKNKEKLTDETREECFRTQEAINKLCFELGYNLKEHTVIDDKVVSPPKEFFQYITQWVQDAKKINQELLEEKKLTFETHSRQVADRLIEILKEEKQKNGN